MTKQPTTKMTKADKAFARQFPKTWAVMSSGKDWAGTFAAENTGQLLDQGGSGLNPETRELLRSCLPRLTERIEAESVAAIEIANAGYPLCSYGLPTPTDGHRVFIATPNTCITEQRDFDTAVKLLSRRYGESTVRHWITTIDESCEPYKDYVIISLAVVNEHGGGGGAFMIGLPSVPVFNT